MNKILLFLLLTTGLASAQIVNIPDVSFKNELISDGVDTNSDGEIQVSEALATTSISLQSSNIANITGIEAFVNLTSFQSDPNQVATIDFSTNVNLVSISIQAAIPPNVGPLTSINIDSCVALENLLVSSSSIAVLDLSSNVNLTSLYIAVNPLLETVFLKNGSDESSNMDPGSWMENWLSANNPSLQYVCADDFQTTEIQQFAGTDYPVNSYCTFPPGGDVNTITGVTKLDDEGNGCDSGDSTIPYTSFNIEFNGNPSNAIAYSNAAGVYNVYAGEAGTYTLLPNLENPNYFNISPSSVDINFPVIDNSSVTQDFCAEANGVHPDLEVVIATAVHARPGFDATYLLVYKNKGNHPLSGDVQFNYPEDTMDFVSSSTTPDSQGNGTMTFNFTDLQPYQTETVEIVLAVNGPMDTPPVNIGDILQLNAQINPVAGDEMPNDNLFTLNQTVIGSFDPNNIVCLQGDEVPTNYIGDYLHYIINFENTGTAPAENVVVTMEIDADDFDPTSLQILNISHDVQIIVRNGIAEFHFQSINLDTGGHGNILLKMKTKSDLNISDIVGAKANIYFDYNFPVETNEAETSFRVLGVEEYNSLKIAIYPNPAYGLINIQAASGIKNIGIYDLQGRLIDTSTINNQNTELNISALTPGVYFLSIETQTGTGFKKFIKH
ncbi:MULTISPECIES: T9SS type A sorting domain-containing protein [Aequorivita]|uniref:T9SS type A sorting domain-containing protein n=1 Tax=Aequorivita iocasae TaxID=2803865 RepID=A0ABX7DP03_9FLAO|nr:MULTISPECIES: T9SS type A sorting domain-containing protein [Aequorivita]QQX75286.1 T9SS type A sorting domain-containing protein [Aequorivita iocasae]UCA54735.1 T9SS type A sorting domain-containing protein [Aequorivita sp. F7]